MPQRTPPDGTGALFALLVAAVVASGSTVFFAVHAALPPWAGADAGGTILVGLSLLFGLAAVIYWRFPSWITRRYGLRLITDENSPALVADLRDLCRTADVAPPAFLLAPRRGTTRGRAFGHAGRRRVMVDAGLGVLSATDPAVFRAVVLHELAHLRNRDVDRAYLTVAAWWAFVVVAVPPMAVLSVSPTVLSGAATLDPWHTLRVSVALVGLTLVVYLVRNALLRERETRADAAAAAWEPDALRRLLAAAVDGTRRSWLSRAWDDHPTPQERVDAIDDPGRLSRPRGWEFFGAGVVAAMLLENGFVLLAMLLPGRMNLANYLTCLVITAGAGAALVLGVCRAAGDRPPGRAAPRVLRYPLLLTAGFLVGEAFALINLAGGRWVMFSQYAADASPTPRSVLTTVAPLLAGAVLVTVWARSAVGGLAEVHRSSRRARLVLVAAAVAGATPWMNIWLTLRAEVDERSPFVTSVPLLLWPREYLFFVGAVNVPGVLAGLIALAVTPLLLGHTGGHRRAVATGAAAGVLGVAAVAVADAPAPATIVACAAAAAGVTVLTVRRRRPVLGLLALLLCGGIGAFGGWLVSDRDIRPLTLWLETVVYGTVAAVPVAIACAGCGALLWLPRRRRMAVPAGTATPVPAPPEAVPAEPVVSGAVPPGTVVAPPTRAVACSAGVAGVLALVSLGNAGSWITFTDTAEPDVGSCVVGRWHETAYTHRWAVDDSITVRLTRSGPVRHFESDGTALLDFGARTVEEGFHNGHRVAFVHRGVLRSRYRVEGTTISYWDETSEGSWVLMVDDRTGRPHDRLLRGSRETVACAGDEMTLTEESYTVTLRRQ